MPERRGDDRIVYGTDAVMAREALEHRAAALLASAGIAYVHVRSSSNNCFQARIERGPKTSLCDDLPAALRPCGLVSAPR